MNSITEFLDLEDEDLLVTDISISGTTKTMVLETKPCARYCPVCQFRMHSRGIKTRTINHPILQDGYKVVLILKQRRWRCSNKQCRYETNETFRFIDRGRRETNASDMLIIQAFRDFSRTAASIARDFNTSDTHVMNVFDRYVHMARLPLTDIISIDEVQIDLDESCKYGMVIQDFHTGDPIDLLPSRRSNVTEPYFAGIPADERSKVKYLISDMYNPYIKFVDKYFPNAVSVVDSFHVVQWMIHGIDQYIRSLLKKYRTRDREQYLTDHPDKNQVKSKPPVSDEVYLLQRYRFLVLSNRDNIHYRAELRMDSHFHRMMNTYDYENSLFQLDPRLRVLRDYKEKYIHFNTINAGNPDSARRELDELIEFYKDCKDSIFMDFAYTLERHRESIINSFVMVQKNGKGGLYDTRLSNGAIESINRSVKDIRRNGRGYQNFDHFRTRFLYGTRGNPVLDATRSNTGTPFGVIEEDDI